MTLFRDGRCEPLKQWPEWAQIAGFTASVLFINLVIGLLIAPLGFAGASQVKANLIQSNGSMFTFFLLVLVAPFTETLYGQWLPIFVGRIAKRPPIIWLLWASCWFSILHIPEGFASIVQNFGIGWVLASCFLFCHDEGWMKAYRVTSISHAIHNLIVFILF